MRDRQPSQPGRVLLTPENGTEAFYAVMEMADNPTDYGTPPTKANLLTDDTEVALFGNAADRTVNDAFYNIGIKLNLIERGAASVSLTLKDQNNRAISGAMVANLFDSSGNTAITDANGHVDGVLPEGTWTLTVSNYGDLEDWSQEITVNRGEAQTINATLTRRNFLRVTSSRNVRYTADVDTVDAAVGGGGGGAGGGAANKTGGGGGGGYSTVVYGLSVTPNELYKAVVGSGGSAGSSKSENGGNGGTSSFMGVTASGGTGGGSSDNGGTAGAGNGPGGAGVNSVSGSSLPGKSGAAGTTKMFTSFTEEVNYGGGGGSGAASRYEFTRAEGGVSLGYGGSGGYALSPSDSPECGNGTAGTNGYGGGGGSGGAAMADNDSGGPDRTKFGTSAKGGSGCIAIRIHLKAA